MAAIDFSRTAFGSAPVANRLRTLFVGSLNAFFAWNDHRKSRNALAGLSDRELEDIGLSRCDIDDVSKIR